MSFRDRYYRNAYDYARQYASGMTGAHSAGMKGALVGSIAGGTIGGLRKGGPSALDTDPNKDYNTVPRRLGHIAIGALDGGLMGYYLGHTAHQVNSQTASNIQNVRKAHVTNLRNRWRTEKRVHSILKSMGGVPKTKRDAERMFKSHLAKSHPDKGGSHEGFIGAKQKIERLKTTDWFKKLGSQGFTASFDKTAAGLPMVIKQPPKVEKIIRRSGRASLLSKLKKRWDHVSDAEKALMRQKATKAGLIGGGLGLIQSRMNQHYIETKRKSGKLTNEEAAALKKKYGYLPTIAKTTAGSVIGNLAGTGSGLLRKRPQLGTALVGSIGGGVLGYMGGSMAASPHSSFNPDKNSDKLHRINNAELANLNRRAYGMKPKKNEHPT